MRSRYVRLLPVFLGVVIVVGVAIIACTSDPQGASREIASLQQPAGSVAATIPAPSLLVRPTATPVSVPTAPSIVATAIPTAPLPPPPTPEPPPAPPEPHSADDVVLNGDSGWNTAIRTLDGGYVGVVTSEELNMRTYPSLDAEIVGSTFERHTLVVYELMVTDGDGGQWYRVGDQRYVSAWYVEPFHAPQPEQTYRGTWVDVNLSSFYAVAYVDETPVYAAIIAAGRDGRTPLGEYHVFYRVRSETMDSATIGIPEDHPEYYYLEDVEYTHYFKDGGFAIHGNYWTPPSEFGGFTSNGCVGMLNADAAWFWDFLGEGSMINIHS